MPNIVNKCVAAKRNMKPVNSMSMDFTHLITDVIQSDIFQFGCNSRLSYNVDFSLEVLVLEVHGGQETGVNNLILR